jgi:hypothetical protein
MVNNYTYCLNLTNFKEHVFLECGFPEDFPYNYQLNVPSPRILGRHLENLEKITQPFLKIEGTLPKGKFNFTSIKRKGSSPDINIISKEKLEKLCENLNQGREEKIYKVTEIKDESLKEK